jgi:hypothetical protein
MQMQIAIRRPCFGELNNGWAKVGWQPAGRLPGGRLVSASLAEAIYIYRQRSKEHSDAACHT